MSDAPRDPAGDPAPLDPPSVAKGDVPRKKRAPGSPKPGGKGNRPGPGNLLWLGLVGVAVLGLIALTTGGRGGKEMSVSRFRALIEDGTLTGENVDNVRFGTSAITFTGPPGLVVDPEAKEESPSEVAAAAEGKTGEDGEPLTTAYRVAIYSLPGDTLTALGAKMDEAGLDTSASEPPPEWAGLAILFLPLLLLVGLLVLVLRKFGGPGAAMSFGKSRGRLAAQDDVEVTFADVAGIDEAKEELKEVVDFLRTPQKYQALGGRIPRGVLLVGPPGTGKTLLAKAVAGEAGVSFFSLSGSDFVEMFVGVGAARVRDMFKQAGEKERAIIFIDELDALGKARGNGAPGGHEEREQTLNALLVEMDGFDSGQSVIVMGATNRPETLDPALLRPGRFDRTVTVDRPDKAGRFAILKVHAKRITLGEGVNLERIAGITPGFVGADLANLMNEAALLAARSGKPAVTMVELEEAIERVVAGLEKGTRLIHDEEKERVSYHECGHALVACSLPHTDPVHKISIIPRGMGLGYTLHFPADERMLTTRTELFNRICCFLGGIAAEDLIYEEASTGAQNDLQRSTDIARRMVTEFGMSDALGRVHYSDARTSFLGPQASGDGFHAEQTLRQIDLEVKAIIDRAGETAAEILSARRPLLDRMAKELLEVEVMDAAHLKRLLDEDTTGPRLSLGTKIGAKAGPTEIELPTSEEATDENEGIDVA
ncbi:ATP-dependent zinc metalloprotease FtsH [Alienimonas chondri]|uniref:ATP-dependent zinc metalloprotease FtsH n=1 Tax=Alienimonas chondri TaxID=2681879 RepID=UPI001FEB668C|nr:ATP-dependent zinc metalloprotease FtsH [Alienimonas chondri]